MGQHFFRFVRLLASNRAQDKQINNVLLTVHAVKDGQSFPNANQLSSNTGSQWVALAHLHLQSSDKLSNNFKQSCLPVVTCLPHYVTFRIRLVIYVILESNTYQKQNRRAHVQTTADVLVRRSTKQNVCLRIEERLLLLIMADFVRENEDEFFWTNQDSQPYLFTRIYGGETRLQVLDAEHARSETEAVEQDEGEGQHGFVTQMRDLQTYVDRKGVLLLYRVGLDVVIDGRLDITSEEDGTQEMVSRQMTIFQLY